MTLVRRFTDWTIRDHRFEAYLPDLSIAFSLGILLTYATVLAAGAHQERGLVWGYDGFSWFTYLLLFVNAYSSEKRRQRWELERAEMDEVFERWIREIEERESEIGAETPES